MERQWSTSKDRRRSAKTQGTGRVVGLPAGAFLRHGGWLRPRKEECLFLTNEAIMSLQTKDRALRTKPNEANFSRYNLVNNFDVQSWPEPQVELGVASQEFLDKQSARP